MKIRFQMTKLYGAASQETKAIALLMFLLKAGHSTMRKFNYNKLAIISGLHHTTVRKRIHLLMEIGLAKIYGHTLILLSPKSRHAARNINLNQYEKRENPQSVKDYERILSIVIVTQPIRDKEHVKNLIKRRNNPTSLRQLKRDRQQCRKLGVDDCEDYMELGISYETLAQKAKCSRTHIAKTVKIAAKNGYIQKQNSKDVSKVLVEDIGSIKEFMQYVDDYAPNSYDYFHINNGILYLVKVHANRYTTLTKNNLV